MRSGEVLNGQTLFDIALQFCGRVEAAFDIAAMNDIAVTSYMQAGAVVALPDIADKRIVAYYTNNGIKPATEWLPEMVGDAVLRTMVGEDIVTRSGGVLTRVVPITPPTKTIADFPTVEFDRDNFVVGFDPAENKEIKFKTPDFESIDIEWEPM
ncbi:MAG: hypothetical protein IKU05_05495 [Bacteroidales bacterium]|nr:hypothetical protein [Bacteroidales bacterium]MBR6438058.1 hypothetical protein [Bacteroidales bacterium]